MNILIAMMLVAEVLMWQPLAADVENVEPATILALIQIESTGDEDKDSESGTYKGLLQIGQAYMTDALEFAGQDPDDVSVLTGNGQYSIQVFDWYLQRYQFIHNYKPKWIAIIHKCGPRGALEIRSSVNDGATLMEAAQSSTTPGAAEFLRRFDKYYEQYSEPYGAGG